MSAPAFHPVQRDRAPNHLPEAVVLAAYEVYAHVFGEQPAMLDPARGYRGGFSLAEIIAFLYARSFPKREWDQRFHEALARR